MAKVWVHTHLPRLQAGDIPDILSVKIPGQRIEYAAFVSLRDCEFRVHERGRLRCVESGVRNVHAWVVGEECNRLAGSWPMLTWPPSPLWRTAVYSPFKGPHFVDRDTLEPVLRADLVIMSGKDVWYANHTEGN